ncbi:hypothetical protein P171DRAFT_492133 [Karstenula rhodostoma CBS 690.94]|uniref:Uncharacterized protein n=1 Tax=Karstenula rhodostoma CBS 690.94 TaxID=1392251 RepID=A0A9P4P4U8_9PLEO|nr:hypothetical protein P171DRAFT_492133 [Karstenula rhodostoma CBS 690.94]
MESGTSLGWQLRHHMASEQGVRLLENGLLDLSETPKHLVEVARSNAIESPLLRLPAEIRNRIFELALSGYDIEIGYGTKVKQLKIYGLYKKILIAQVSANRFRMNLDVHVEWESGDGKKQISTGCKEFPFYLPQVCRMAYSESVTKGFHINAATFTKLSLLLPTVGVWARSLTTAHFEAISSITMPAQAYVPHLGYSRMRGGTVISDKFPCVKYVYARGGYPLCGFALWGLAKEHAIDDVDIFTHEAQIRGRYAGWSGDQFVSLIRQIFTEVEGKGVELILDGSPTDLAFFKQG